MDDIYIELSEGLEIKIGVNGYSLFSTKKFNKNDFLYKSELHLIPYKNFNDDYIIYNLYVIDNLKNTKKYDIVKNHTTIYNNIDKIAVWLFDSFVNHSCIPNVTMKFFSSLLENKTVTFEMYALQDINIGDEITNNYLEFYYDSLNFECNCCYEKCYKNISGYKYLNDIQKNDLLDKIDKNILEVLEYKKI